MNKWVKLDNFIDEFSSTYDREEFVLGYLRYEELRKLNVGQFAELIQRNLLGENFDEMVDELIIKNIVNE